MCSTEILWNGSQCVGGKMFYKELQQCTTEDIEMRVCRDQPHCRSSPALEKNAGWMDTTAINTGKFFVVVFYCSSNYVSLREWFS